MLPEWAEEERRAVKYSLMRQQYFAPIHFPLKTDS